jgi:hypothetical protein
VFSFSPQGLDISPLSAAAHAAQLWLALAFARRRAAWALGRPPPPPPPPLAAREAAVRAAASAAAARAAAAASRAAPLLAEAWALLAALFSGVAPDVTLRLAVTLFSLARLCALVSLRPWAAALAALLTAFTAPPLCAAHARELALLRAAAAAALARAAAAAAEWLPAGAPRAAAAAAVAWGVWAGSGAGTRAFLLFIAVVGGSDWLGRRAAAWAHHAGDSRGECDDVAAASGGGGCTLRELGSDGEEEEEEVAAAAAARAQRPPRNHALSGGGGAAARKTRARAY